MVGGLRNLATVPGGPITSTQFNLSALAAPAGGREIRDSYAAGPKAAARKSSFHHDVASRKVVPD